MNILDLLDEQISGFYQRTGNYPKKIIMSPGSKEKLFSELELGTDLSNSWADKKDNYKNIPIEVKDIDFLKLEG
jgi:hypothetical protein